MLGATNFLWLALYSTHGEPLPDEERWRTGRGSILSLLCLVSLSLLFGLPSLSIGYLIYLFRGSKQPQAMQGHKLRTMGKLASNRAILGAFAVRSCLRKASLSVLI